MPAPHPKQGQGYLYRIYQLGFPPLVISRTTGAVQEDRHMAHNIQNKDTHTLCPVGGLPAAFQVGQTLKVTRGEESVTLKVTGVTPYMAFFKGQGALLGIFHGATKGTPVSVEVEIVG